MIFKPFEYQQKAIERTLESSIGLFLKPGLGKTVITLTALETLMHDRFEIRKTLIIAPKRVCTDVWPEEIEKWDHLTLTYSLVVGTPLQRIEALKQKRDLYIVSRDNVAWLVSQYKKWPFDCIVIDELSNFKAWSSQRFKSLKRVRAATKRVIGLTGTPRPNGDLDLWAQLFLIDSGVRLGRTITEYKSKYFFRPNPYMPYKWLPKPNSDEKIQQNISDVCISIDYQNQPPRPVDRIVTLSPDQMSTYKRFEREMVLNVEGKTITASSRAIVLNKLLQFANGAIYDDEREVQSIHSAKIEALEELIEEANGSPVLVFYQYTHDRDRIFESLKDYQPRLLNSQIDCDDWNEGKIKVMLAHPLNCGYGLNLQHGGHLIVWFSLTWSQEQYEQANARLHRTGQKESVIIHRLITKGTADELVTEVLENKHSGQEELFEALRLRVLET